MIELAVLLVGGYLAYQFFFAQSPDRTVTHTTDLMGRKVTKVSDRNGRRERRVRTQNVWGENVTKVYQTKKCYKCGADVSASDDGRFRCCGRTWR